LREHPATELAGAKLGGLHDGETDLQGPNLDRWWRQREAPTGRLIRLTDDPCNGCDIAQRIERGHGEGRGAEEKRTQWPN
jgi:hypothetical protein